MAEVRLEIRDDRRDSALHPCLVALLISIIGGSISI